MKKVIVVIFSLCFFCSASFAQTTYYYKHVKRISADGTMKRGFSDGRYFTFVGDVMYESDENGNLMYRSMGPFIGSYASKYHYKASKNGCRIYYEYVEPTAWSSGYYDEDDYMMVSSDRSVVNWHSVSVIDGQEEIYVFHRANKSDEIQDLIY